MIFKGMKNEVEAQVVLSDSNIIGNWVNRGALKVSHANDWKVMRRLDTITAENGTEVYNLPFDFDRPAFVYHTEFGYRFPVGRLSEQQYIEGTPEDTEEGDIYWYRMWEEIGVNTQMSSGAVLKVKSSSTSDTISKDITIRVEGLVSSQPDAESFILNGETDVTGLKTFTRIDKITKNKETTGRITIYDGTTTFATLPVSLVSNTLKQKRIRFRFIPDSDDTVYIGYYARPFYMVDDNDTHGMGDEFDEAIMFWAKHLGRDRAQDPQLKFSVLTDYRREIRDLRGWDNESTEPQQLGLWHGALKSPRFARFSGGYWPYVG